MAVKVQAVISAWRSFELGTVQRELDEAASDLASRQDLSEDSRKKLVDLSREFKKNTHEDVRKQVAPLLKSFQTEIDSLNKRSKHVETAFLNVYKKVIDIEDPLPTLEYCSGLEKKVGRLTDLEIENKNLRETLREYNEEFKEVRNQDVTIKALKEKIKNYEDLMDDNIQSKSKELEKELSSRYAEKERLLHEAQESVVRRLQEAEARVSLLKSSLDSAQSELFELKSNSDETNFAKLEETDILINDLERANQRATTAEREANQLKEQLHVLSNAQNDALTTSVSSINEVESSADSLARSSLEIELASKDKEISQLVEDVQQLQSSLSALRNHSSQQVINLESKLDGSITTISNLQDKIARQKDYEEIKRELNIMKSVEFGAGASNISTGEMMESSTLPKPLEILLLEKTKSLQNENTSLKQSNAGLTEALSETEQECTTLRSVVAEQKDLIISLESDLSSVQSLSTLYRGEGEGSSMPEIVAEAVRESSVNSCTPPLVPLPPHTETRTPTPGGAPPDFPSAAESLLPIVSSQRERFRQRNEELEADLTGKTQQVVLLQNELDSLRADNLKLYEKIRFLQSYQGRSSREDTAAESRYSSQYEEALDPFASFSRKEKLRRYSALSPFEKVTLSMGRFILSNKTARTVTFIYTALVHSLIFLVLYKLAHTESCKRDFASDCAQKFAEHMHQVHGDQNVEGHH